MHACLGKGPSLGQAHGGKGGLALRLPSQQDKKHGALLEGAHQKGSLSLPFGQTSKTLSLLSFQMEPSIDFGKSVASPQTSWPSWLPF